MALRLKTYKNSGEDLCDKEHVVREFLQNRFEYIVRDTIFNGITTSFYTLAVKITRFPSQVVVM